MPIIVRPVESTVEKTCQPCATTVCDRIVFDRVVVSYLIAGGGSVVLWTLAPEFAEPGPLTFTLQVGNTASGDAGDWQDVGLPVTDQYYAVDAEQRVWGKENWTHYRLKLVTGKGNTYFSAPVGGLGTLGPRDWRHAREIVRKERLYHRLNFVGQDGYLLKRRWTGTKCPECLDYQTGEVRKPECPTCLGTGYLCGYYYPMACVWSSLQTTAYRIHLDDSRGTINDVVVTARMLNVTLLEEEDIWIAAARDDRYFVHEVVNRSEVRGFPLAADVKLRLAPASSIIYEIPIPQQLERIIKLEQGV